MFTGQNWIYFVINKGQVAYKFASLVFPLPKAPALHGVFTARPGKVRAYTSFNQAAKPENSPFRPPIQSISLKLRRVPPRRNFFSTNHPIVQPPTLTLVTTTD